MGVQSDLVPPLCSVSPTFRIEHTTITCSLEVDCDYTMIMMTIMHADDMHIHVYIYNYLLIDDMYIYIYHSLLTDDMHIYIYHDGLIDEVQVWFNQVR